MANADQATLAPSTFHNVPGSTTLFSHWFAETEAAAGSGYQQHRQSESAGSKPELTPSGPSSSTRSCNSELKSRSTSGEDSDDQIDDDDDIDITTDRKRQNSFDFVSSRWKELESSPRSAGRTQASSGILTATPAPASIGSATKHDGIQNSQSPPRHTAVSDWEAGIEMDELTPQGIAITVPAKAHIHSGTTRSSSLQVCPPLRRISKRQQESEAQARKVLENLTWHCWSGW
ncbi:hypothetical protein LTR37_009724 [Vermiconidia calcicola]|uniref:Uncharacterized protein n=1 Tax=Vermiconidia calcicola TaxID=1690605 RepID=A0ACC3N6Y4_9PEZI|nr:hypothetical protein LTR37_009724 [Vermiconidia calcicola]